LQLLLALPVQSFSCPSPAGLMAIFYCLRFETPPTWRAKFTYLYPPATGWPSYTPRHQVPFRCLLQLAGLQWRYLTPPSRRKHTLYSWQGMCTAPLNSNGRGMDPHRKYHSSIVAHVFVSAGTCLPRRCLEMGSILGGVT
jgi:hypothetical protein